MSIIEIPSYIRITPYHGLYADCEGFMAFKPMHNIKNDSKRQMKERRDKLPWFLVDRKTWEIKKFDRPVDIYEYFGSQNHYLHTALRHKTLYFGHYVHHGEEITDGLIEVFKKKEDDKRIKMLKAQESRKKTGFYLRSRDGEIEFFKDIKEITKKYNISGTSIYNLSVTTMYIYNLDKQVKREDDEREWPDFPQAWHVVNINTGESQIFKEKRHALKFLGLTPQRFWQIHRKATVFELNGYNVELK